MNTRVTRLRQAARRHLLDALDERGLVSGFRIEFPTVGQCQLRPFEETLPGPGQVLVETSVSAVSSGTERAYFLGRSAGAEYPLVPGYSQSGRVVEVGPGARFHPGQLVATTGQHASLHLSSAGWVAVADGVNDDEAAFAPLGVIALQAVRRARTAAGETVAVFGCGVLGQLAAQLARAAGGRVTAIARSPRRLAVARGCGIGSTIDARREAARIPTLQASVIIEATGSPAAVNDALSAAAPGARIILLGSSRAPTRAFRLDVLREKEIQLIGAHAGTMPGSESGVGEWSWSRECDAVLDLIRSKRLKVTPFVTHRVSPTQAPEVFAELAGPADSSVGVLFDWARPGSWRSRIRRPSPLRGMGRLIRRAAGRWNPPASFMRARADGRRVRFGLVGCGEIAVSNASAIRAASNATITHTYDPEERLAAEIAASTSARVARELDELLADPNVDAVLICAPHHLHAPLAIQSMDAGKHVVVEKPMSTNYADAVAMQAAARRNHVQLSVCYAARFDAKVRRAKQLIEAGVLGGVIATRIVFGQYRGRDYWEAGLTGRTRGDWRSRRHTAGGGVLIMNACHLLDYVGWLADDDVAEVTSCTATLSHDVEVEDTVCAAYRYEGGGLGTLLATTGLIGPDSHEQVLWGRRGQVVVSPTLRFWSETTVDGYEAGRWHEIADLPRTGERRHYFESFSAALLENQDQPVTAVAAARVQATIDAIYRAGETGRRCIVEELPGTPVSARE